MTLVINNISDTVQSTTTDVTITCATNKTLVVSPVAYDDTMVPATLSRSGAVAPEYATGFVGNANLYTINMISGQYDEVQFQVQLPHCRADNSTIHPHVHFSPYTTGTGTVRFVLEYTWASIDTQFGSTNTVNLEKTWNTNQQWYHLLATPNPAGGITGTGKGISSILVCRLYRDYTVTGNYTDKVTFLGFDFHIEMDTLGSRQATTK